MSIVEALLKKKTVCLLIAFPVHSFFLECFHFPWRGTAIYELYIYKYVLL